MFSSGDSQANHFCESSPSATRRPSRPWLYVRISVSVDTPNSRVVIVVAINNLLKGQAGVALQNINLMFG
jgi:N-acetyl-gamma-glutamylphosphate reductase